MARPTMEAEGRLGLAGLPIGFRFCPTDEELLLHYLRHKALGCPLPADIIPVADLARLHPWDLVAGDGDGERFFFHLPATRCWRRGGGAARAAGAGVWKASGKEKLVMSLRCKRPVGAKRTLVFCLRGGNRTDWAMHEYRLLPAAIHLNPPPLVSCHGAAPEAKDWVVCRIFKRTKPAGRGRFSDAGEALSSPSSASSCVTDTSETGGQEEVDEQSSSSSSICSVAFN
uniref:NAC domain-containing protein n=1 Tax=Arundo donax TaxID=35708 RepID=A0A0A9GFU0_ARUDO